MNKLIKQWIFGEIDEREPIFKEKLEKADVNNLTAQTLFDSEILSEIDQVNLYFILEYKLAYLMKNGTNSDIGCLNCLISIYLFHSLTPIFGRELAIKYAEDACKFDNNDENADWLKYVTDEKYIKF